MQERSFGYWLRRAAALTAALSAMVLISGCGDAGKGNGAGAADNKIVVASEASFPPMEYVDDGGQIVGFDIDLIKAVAQEAGLQVEIKNVPWEGIFGALKSGNADVIASSVTITDERKAQFDFTEPYLHAGQVLVVRAADREKYPNLDALKGKPVGVQIGTTGAQFVEKQAGYELKQFNTAGLAIIELVNGNVEAAVIDKPVADYYATKKPEYAKQIVVAGEPQTSEQFGFVVRKGETELLGKLNKALEKVKENGRLEQIESEWFR